MKKGVTIGGILAILLLIGAIIFCALIAPKINEKLSEINQPIPKKTVENLPKTEQPQTPSEAEKTFLALGNPSKATTNINNFNNFLLLNNYYAVSYNRDKGLANWVAWTLKKENFGDADRQNDYRPDERLPSDWKKIFPSYYIRSGYDRGHLVPSADRTNSIEANSSTFLMTNMTPQTPDLNQGSWEKLETYSRSMARRNNDLYIYTGGYGQKTKLQNTVSVPTNFWKIIVVVPRGSQINSQTRVIAVDIPNIYGIKETNWRDYRTSVRNIEQKTGYDFLSALPKDMQNVLEMKVDAR